VKSLVIVAFALIAASSTAASQDTYKDCTKTAGTQSELTQCAGEDAKRADAELNRVYQQLLLKARGDEHAIAKVRASQRAWLSFRDAQLSALFPREDKQAEYGSMYPMCYANFAAEMTRQRTEQLRRMLEKWAPEGAGCWY
jgi:uncharacterized protein YecT (DUF1311 family)